MYLVLLCSIFHTVTEVFVVTQTCRQFAGLNDKLVVGSGEIATLVSITPSK